MAPRDFSEDGAWGAGTQQEGSPTGGVQMHDPGPNGGWSMDPTDYMSHYKGGGIDADPGHYDHGPQGYRYQAYTDNEMAGAKSYADNLWGNPDGMSTPGTYKSGSGGFWGPGTSAQPGDRGYQAPGSAPRTAAGFSQGGSISDADNDFDGTGSPEQEGSVQRDLANVMSVLAYGYKKHGLQGDNGAIKQAGMYPMPTRPGGQSESGIPPAQPGPGTLPPTANPFGKRADAGEGEVQTAANMPVRPAGQSETGIPPAQPGPGTLPPTNNPFGKRADAGDNDGDEAPAIDTSEEDVA